MQPLNLHIKHRIRPHSQPKRCLNMMRQPLFIPLLNRKPLLAELSVLGVIEQTLELEEVFEPDVFLQLESLGDEVAEFGVALVEPAARGDCIWRVSTARLSARGWERRTAVRDVREPVPNLRSGTMTTRMGKKNKLTC